MERLGGLNIWQTIERPGYVAYFSGNLSEATLVTDNYSYAYDKDLISKSDAFDIYALYNKPRKPDQFHHVAFNLALERVLRIPFTGARPLQVREGKPGTPESDWPAGWRWSPGRIPCIIPNLIPYPHLDG